MGLGRQKYKILCSLSRRLADFTLEYFATPKHFQEVEDIDKLLAVGFAGNRVKLIKLGNVLPIFMRNSGV